MMTVLPTSRIPDPFDAPPLRWGILAPGGIAASMGRALQRSSQRILAVGSRTQTRADAYAAQFDVERSYGSYERLLSDPDVDAVYIASPHSSHHEQALMAIAAGKHVLVEKSFTRNAAEAREVVAAARAAKVTCVEAMWPRFAPRFDIVRQVLEDGVLGEIVAVAADHCQSLRGLARMEDPALAGGALMDLGIYPVSFLSFVLGSPSTVKAVGHLSDRGVDLSIAGVATGYASAPEAVATFTTSMSGRSPAVATIVGTEARLELGSSFAFYQPGPVRLVRRDGTVIEAPEAEPASKDALVFEACHLAHLVGEGATESPYLPLDETVSIMETMDEIRRQVGLVFPGE